MQSPSLIENLVSEELEKLGIKKKYLGFKYLKDLIVEAFRLDFSGDIYTSGLLARIAASNEISEDCAERNIRHMLQKCIINKSILKNELSDYIDENFKLTTKNLLSTMVAYFKHLF